MFQPSTFQGRTVNFPGCSHFRKQKNHIVVTQLANQLNPPKSFHTVQNDVNNPICAMVKSRNIGDGHPTFNRNPYNGYINPYYWVEFPIPYYMEIMGVDRPWHI